jgi:hypothetical protein
MQSYYFILQLNNTLISNQPLGNNYQFIKWMPNGGLQFQINQNQRKTIPTEILMLAYHIDIRNNRINSPILINKKWLKSNGYSDWCFIEVISFLLENYNQLL